MCNETNSILAWLWIALGLLYFFVPLYATLDFSLRAEKDKIGLAAYANVFSDALFYESFNVLAPGRAADGARELPADRADGLLGAATLPQLRPVIEFVTPYCRSWCRR